MPVTFCPDESGTFDVLSRYGDAVIDFSYHCRTWHPEAKLRTASIPSGWHDSVLELVIAYWRYGRPGQGAPETTTVVSTIPKILHLTKYLASIGLSCFADVRPIHVQSYATLLKDSKVKRKAGLKARSPLGLHGALSVLSLAWDMRQHISDSMTFAPLERGDLSFMSDYINRGPRRPRTKALSDTQSTSLFLACEDCLSKFDSLYPLHLRVEAWRRDNRGLQSGHARYRKDLANYAVSQGMPLAEIGTGLTQCMAAAFIELGLLVGLRISELLDLRAGCYYETEIEGRVIGWLRGRTFKMRKKGAEAAVWMAPRRVGEIIRILENLSKDRRDHLAQKIKTMQAELAALGANSPGRKSLIRSLARLSYSQDHLFIVVPRGNGRGAGNVVGRVGARYWIQTMSRRAGLTCPLSIHVLRRTFAVTVTHQCAGDLRYLKQHFQHWSIETTQLYAMHDEREKELIDEIANEMLLHKTAVVANWLTPGTTLSGKAGRHISGEREKPEFRGATPKRLADLTKGLAEGVVLRSTGHSWCISSGLPTCGGQGLYDATHCADCDGAVVAEEHKKVWTGLALQMLEVERLSDCGPSGADLVRRSLDSFDRILEPLGTSVAELRLSANSEDGK